MKIEMSGDSERIPLRHVREGEVFEYKSRLYIKMMEGINTTPFNVLRLFTGEVFPFNEDTLVIFLPEAKVVA